MNDEPEQVTRSLMDNSDVPISAPMEVYRGTTIPVEVHHQFRPYDENDNDNKNRIPIESSPRKSDKLRSKPAKFTMKEAGKLKDDSLTFREKFDMFGLMCCGASTFVCWIIIYILLIILPLAMIIIGGMYVNDCPIEPLIPTFLIVFGVFAIVLCIVEIVERVISKRNLKKEIAHEQFDEEDPEQRAALHKHHSIFGTITTVLCLFLFCWFICGNVWVFSIDGQVEFNKLTMELNDTQLIFIGRNPNYCAEDLYKFAYAILIIHWLILLVLLIIVPFVLCCCCVCACAKCFNISKKNDDED